MFMSVCIFAWMVCASALSFLDGKICAIQEPSFIIIIIIIIIWLRLERGTIQSSAHLSPETEPALLLAILLDPSFSSTGVRNSLSEFCVLCLKWRSAKRRPEICRFSHTAHLGRSAVAFCKQMLGELVSWRKHRAHSLRI